VLYHGDKKTREEIRKKYFSMKQLSDKFPIIVTSYEIIMNDRQYLSRIQWKFIIIDEGIPSFEISNTRPSNQEFELQIGSGIEEL
jgi:hypothetical protein